MVISIVTINIDFHKTEKTIFDSMEPIKPLIWNSFTKNGPTYRGKLVKHRKANQWQSSKHRFSFPSVATPQLNCIPFYAKAEGVAWLHMVFDSYSAILLDVRYCSKVAACHAFSTCHKRSSDPLISTIFGFYSSRLSIAKKWWEMETYNLFGGWEYK